MSPKFGKNDVVSVFDRFPSKEAPPPVYEDAGHLTGTCDNCKEAGAFGYCVTSRTKHLHACRLFTCKEALEVKLHG